MCPFQSCDFCVLIPLIWDLYEAGILGGENDSIFIFISLAIETPILSEYIPENIYVLFYLLIAKFKKAKILPSWFLTTSAIYCYILPQALTRSELPTEFSVQITDCFQPRHYSKEGFTWRSTPPYTATELSILFTVDFFFRWKQTWPAASQSIIHSSACLHATETRDYFYSLRTNIGGM